MDRKKRLSALSAFFADGTAEQLRNALRHVRANKPIALRSKYSNFNVREDWSWSGDP